MNLTRHSKIKEILRHPLGHDILQQLQTKNGWNRRWMEASVWKNLPLSVLDRYAGPGFADLVLEICSAEPGPGAQPELEPHAWWKETVVYQIFLPSFMDSDHDGVGDLGGVQQRLAYLANLGVNTLWLRPLLPESGGETEDFLHVNPDMGGDDAFTNLLNAAKEREMRVILSLELAGVSEDHPWFREALRGGEKRDYFFLRPGKADAPPNNWELSPGVRAWKYFPQQGLWALRTGGRRHMDLNWENPKLREEMAAVLRHWRGRGVDGFCLGGAGLLSKASLEDGGTMARGLLGRTGLEHYNFGPRLHLYLKELRENALTEDILAMGEWNSFGSEMAKMLTGEGRTGLDMALDNSHLAPPLRARGSDETVVSLQDLRRYYLYWMEQYGNENWMSLFFENADTPRLLSRLGASPLYRSILAKLLGSWLLTMRGTPVLFQGEELGIAGARFSSADELRDPDTLLQYTELCERQGLSEQAALQKVLRGAADGARTPIPWSGGPCCGFTGAIPWMRLPDGAEHLNVAHQTADPCSVWQHYQTLISLRKQHPCLVYGSFKPVFTKNPKVLCYFRILGHQKWYVELNLTEKQVSRPGRILRSQRLVLSNYDSPSRQLRPYEANLYFCENS